MKFLTTFFFAVFFAGSALAQDQTQQQIPVSMLTDTTSGWQVVFSNSLYHFEFMQFPSQSMGYAVASDLKKLVLFRSTNQGVSWDSVGLPPIGKFTFISATTGFCADENVNLVWKTTNGGQDWNSVNRQSAPYGPLVFADSDTGFILGPSGTVKTTNAGETWQAVPGFGPDKFDASFADSKVGYAVGITLNDPPQYLNYEGWCQKTTDGGVTWNWVHTNIDSYLYCCKAVDKNILIVGGDSKIGRTLNGGQTWDSLIVLGFFQSISFSNQKHGLIVGGDGPGSNPHCVIYSTQDTGSTWQKQYIPNAPLLTSIVMISDSVAITCGGGNIYRTATGGIFSSVSNQASYNFQLQIFPNPTSGVLSLQYQLRNPSPVTLQFYNTLGSLVGSLDLGFENAGNNQAVFNGSTLRSGAYVANITAGRQTQTVSFSIQR
jgi:photosystem II stability/assembly factor-like uncharacterized protein